MPTILAIRHGECEDGAAGILNGLRDPELTEKGRLQAERLARSLGDRAMPAAVYSSDLLRAAQTARIVTDTLGLPPALELPILRERCLGVVTGMSYPQALATVPESARFVASNGTTYSESAEYGFETFNEVAARMRRFISYLNRSHITEDEAWVFTHGDATIGLAEACTGTPWRQIVDQTVRIENTGVVTLQDGSEEITVTNPAQLSLVR